MTKRVRQPSAETQQVQESPRNRSAAYQAWSVLLPSTGKLPCNSCRAGLGEPCLKLCSNAVRLATFFSRVKAPDRLRDVGSGFAGTGAGRPQIGVPPCRAAAAAALAQHTRVPGAAGPATFKACFACSPSLHPANSIRTCELKGNCLCCYCGLCRSQLCILRFVLWQT